MTLEKAIEIIQDILRLVEPGDPPDEHDALKISMEAVKEVKHLRGCHGCFVLEKLPGETKE